MSASIFVDTNVLLYAIYEADPQKNVAARMWMRAFWEAERGRLSFQVLQEFYANFLRRWPKELQRRHKEKSTTYWLGIRNRLMNRY